MSATGQIKTQLEKLAACNTAGIFNNDFLLTWDHDGEQIKAVF